MFWVFGNALISDGFLYWWEPAPRSAAEMEDSYDLAIVLGGYSNFLVQAPRDLQHFNDRANRFNNTLELYGRGKVQRILLSGGSGALVRRSPPEAEVSAAFLRTIGLPDSAIIVEARSRNTRENARYTAQLLEDRYPGARCLLITSAFHMPRAHACFKKAGVTCDTFPVDYLQETPVWTPDYWLLPRASRLGYWELLIKEWVGWVVYKMRGWA